MFDVIRHIFTIPLQNQRNSKGESRSSLTRGDVVNYLLNYINYKEWQVCYINLEVQFESIAVEVETKHSKNNIIITEIYPIPMNDFQ